LRSLKNFDERKQSVRAARTKKARVLDAASNPASNILFFWLCSRNSRPFWSLITIGRHAAVNIATNEIKILNRASQTMHHQRPNTNMRIAEL